MTKEIRAYNEAKSPERRAICDRLYAEIHATLPEAEVKLWHGAPVWFLAGLGKRGEFVMVARK